MESNCQRDHSSNKRAVRRFALPVPRPMRRDVRGTVPEADFSAICIPTFPNQVGRGLTAPL